MFENKVVIGRQGKGLRIKGFPLFLSPFPCLAPALSHNFILILAGVYCEWQEFINWLQLPHQLRHTFDMRSVREKVKRLNVFDTILFRKCINVASKA